MTTDNTVPLSPDAALLCKLGSIAVHVEEMLSASGHQYDRIALDGLLKDPDVKKWLAAMRKMAMLPEKRR